MPWKKFAAEVFETGVWQLCRAEGPCKQFLFPIVAIINGCLHQVFRGEQPTLEAMFGHHTWSSRRTNSIALVLDCLVKMVVHYGNSIQLNGVFWCSYSVLISFSTPCISYEGTNGFIQYNFGDVVHNLLVRESTTTTPWISFLHLWWWSKMTQTTVAGR